MRGGLGVKGREWDGELLFGGEGRVGMLDEAALGGWRGTQVWFECLLKC